MAIVLVVAAVVLVSFVLGKTVPFVRWSGGHTVRFVRGEIAHRHHKKALEQEEDRVFADAVRLKVLLDQEAFRAARAMHDVARSHRNWSRQSE